MAVTAQVGTERIARAAADAAEAALRVLGDTALAASVSTEALARSAAISAEATQRVGGDAAEAAARNAFMLAADNRLDNFESILSMGQAATPAQLTFAAAAANIADIGSDGSTLTILTEESHNMSDGDYITVAGTDNYDGTYGPINVIAADEITAATVIPADDHEIVGYISTAHLRVASHNFQVGMFIEVVNDSGEYHTARVVSGTTSTLIKLTAPVPITWIETEKASANAPVASIPMEVVAARYALQFSEAYVAQSLAEALRQISGRMYHVDRYGAVQGSTSDEAIMSANVAAFNDANDAAFAAGGYVVAEGEYWVNDTVVITTACEMWRCTLHSTVDDGVALLVGTDAQYTSKRDLLLPAVRLDAHVTADGWSTGTGVKLMNIRESNIYLNHVLGFTVGVDATTSGALSFLYNQVYPNTMQNNKIGFRMGPGVGSTGASNENLIIGGRWAFDVAEDIREPGTIHIQLIARNGNAVNNNVFVKPSIEAYPEFQIQLTGASYNQFVSARYEVGGAEVPHVDIKGYNYTGASWITSQYNLFNQGYQSDEIVFTEDSHSQENSLSSYRKMVFVGRGGNIGTIAAATQTGTFDSPIFAAFRSSRMSEAMDGSKNEWWITDTHMYVKAYTDANYRFSLNFETGAMAWGNGAGTDLATLTYDRWRSHAAGGTSGNVILGNKSATKWPTIAILDSTGTSASSVPTDWTVVIGAARTAFKAKASLGPGVIIQGPSNRIVFSDSGGERWLHTLTGGSSGTFTFSFDGVTSGTIAYNATTAAYQAVLEAMSNLGVGNVTVGGSAGAWSIRLKGILSSVAIPSPTVNVTLVGGSPVSTMVYQEPFIAYADVEVLEIYRALKLTNTSTALPTCTSTLRGRMRRVEGAAGVADKIVVCDKPASDVYAWRTLV